MSWLSTLCLQIRSGSNTSLERICYLDRIATTLNFKNTYYILQELLFTRIILNLISEFEYFD